MIGFMFALLLTQAETTPAPSNDPMSAEANSSVDDAIDDLFISNGFLDTPENTKNLLQIRARGRRNDSWLSISMSKDNEETFLRMKDFKTTLNGGVFWFKRISIKPKVTTEKMIKERINCITEKSTILASTSQTGNDPISTFEYEGYQQKETSIIPETIGESMMKAVCIGK